MLFSGKGMFGDIFLAKARCIRDSEPETLVLVKNLIIKDEHLYFEFRQEMDMFSKLDHPYIVKLLGVCREVEPHYMITEYCDWVGVDSRIVAVLPGVSRARGGYYLHCVFMS